MFVPMTEETAPTPDPEPRRQGLRRWQRGAIVVAFVAAAGLGLAAGTGLSPGDAKETVLQRLYGDPEPQIDRAAVVASDSAGPASIEVLLAPTDRGRGECIVIRTDWRGPTPDGSTGVAGQQVRCSFDGPMVGFADPEFRILRPADRFGLLIEVPIGPPAGGAGSVALVGAVYEDVESITADFGDGAQYTFNVVSDDGWFAVVLPAGVVDVDRFDGTLVNRVASLKLIDLDGRVSATIEPVPT